MFFSKRKKLILVIVVMSFLCLPIIVGSIVSVWYVAKYQADDIETFLVVSESPDAKYKIEAYRIEPGATVDFSIKAYIVGDNKKQLIYNAYHERTVEIFWIDSSKVSINGRILNLSNQEKYDWRKD